MIESMPPFRVGDIVIYSGNATNHIQTMALTLGHLYTINSISNYYGLYWSIRLDDTNQSWHDTRNFTFVEHSQGQDEIYRAVCSIIESRPKRRKSL